MRDTIDTMQAVPFILWLPMYKALYNLAENCDYGDFKEELICDRFMVSIQDLAVPECHQMDPELTLEKVKKAVHQKEAIKEHQLLWKMETPGATLSMSAL